MSQETTQRLAAFAATLTLDAIPEDVRDACKTLLLDALACALAGHKGDETGQIHALAAALGQSDETSVIGGGGLSLAGATLLNGFLITAVTMCDTHRPTLTHITPEVIPPALAIAERDAVPGRDLLVAIAAGCEITTRVGIGLDYKVFRDKGWHGPGVIGPFGGAAAVGSLRGLDAAAMARAFGLAGSQSAGTFAAWGTPTVKFHQCRGALSGLMATLLAEQEFVATEEILTAPDGGIYNTYSNGGLPELATADLGERWELHRIALRLWPSATHLQTMITAMFDIVERHDIGWDDVARVRVDLCETPYAMHGGFAEYRAKFEAMLSAHYVAAVVLRDRALTLSQFEPACYDDPQLRRFAAERVEIGHDPSLVDGQVRIEISGRDGSAHSTVCDHPRGAPENPVSRGDIEEKFRIYARELLDEKRVEQIIEAVGALETLDSSATLMALLRTGSG
jgi:2-methylcitrate dehydratase PrpD